MFSVADVVAVDDPVWYSYAVGHVWSGVFEELNEFGAEDDSERLSG